MKTFHKFLFSHNTKQSPFWKFFLTSFCLFTINFSFLSCVSTSSSQNISVIYGLPVSEKEMSCALENLNMFGAKYTDYFNTQDFIAHFETKWESYYSAGEILLSLFSGLLSDTELQQKYIITLYKTHYEITGVYKIIDKSADSFFYSDFTQKEIPIEKNSKGWTYMETFATSLEKELSFSQEKN